MATDSWITQVVLITESSMVNRIIERGLDPKRFEIHIFTSGESELTEKLLAINPKIIFLKNLLKNINGFDLCERFKRNHTLKQSRIIVLSSDANLLDQAYQHYVNHFLTIPFTSDEVSRVVSQLFIGKKNILLVDDSKLLHKKVVPELIQEGYNVLQAWNGKEALWLLAEQEIDLIITDVEMPELNGFELCEAVKSQNLHQVPVLMLSSHDSENDIVRAFNVGADDYITKPVFMNELLSRVRRMSGAERRSHRERILVVDESPIVRGMITQALLSQGFKVDDVDNAEDALSMLQAKTYQLITIDCSLQVIGGYQLCLAIRQNEKSLDLPIIIISAMDSKSQRIKLRSIGIQSFISKPFKKDWLITETERVLAESKLKQERQAIRRYLSDETMQAVDRHSLVGAHQKKTLAWDRHRTVFVVDIMNFCVLCEEKSSSDVIYILNHFIERMVQILTHYDAVIDKFFGDSILALFGHEADGAHRAGCAAREMQKAMPEINKKLKVALSIRIGLNSGNVIMGDIGSALYRRDFAVIGNNVILAQHIKNLAKANEIIISRNTLELVADIVKIVARDTIKIDTRNETMDIFLLQSIQPYKHR